MPRFGMDEEYNGRWAIRWMLVPFTYLVACGIGVWVWYSLGSLFVDRCPAELLWYGRNRNCNGPLWAYFAKDVIGVSVIAVLAVAPSAGMAPSHKRTTAFVAATISCMPLAFLLSGFFRFPLRYLVGAIFVLVLYLTAALIAKCRSAGTSSPRG
jgi:hypothetical protein